MKRILLHALAALLTLIAGCKKSREPPEILLKKYQQGTYIPFSGTGIEPYDDEKIFGMDLWEICPMKSVPVLCFLVGTQASGRIVESEEVFQRLYSPILSANEAAELAIRVHFRGPGYRRPRHPLFPLPRTTIAADKVPRWLEPPKVEAGHVIFWTDLGDCYRLDVEPATGKLSVTTHRCYVLVEDAGVDPRSCCYTAKDAPPGLADAAP